MTQTLRKDAKMASPKTARAEESINMLTLLQTHRRGEILTEANAALPDVIDAIRQYGGKGKLTLTLSFKLEKGDQISLTPDLKTEKPRRPMSTGIFYATDDGTLTRRDPNQGDWVGDDLASRRGGNDD